MIPATCLDSGHNLQAIRCEHRICCIDRRGKRLASHIGGILDAPQLDECQREVAPRPGSIGRFIELESERDGFLREPDRVLELLTDDGRLPQIDQRYQQHPRVLVLQPPRDLRGFHP